jgi:hypothetical protein
MEADMSINSLANAAAARRPDTLPLHDVPKGVDEIARASARPPSDEPISSGENLPAAGRAAPVDTTFNVLFGYIPTEVLTLYVAVLAALDRTETSVVSDTQWITFWMFLAATPLVTWLVFAAKLKSIDKPFPLSFAAWPVWEMLAATLAFFAWAMALPHSPFTRFERTWYSPAVAGVAVLVTSTILGLLSPFFQRPLGTGERKAPPG